jgi:beta-ribofuranosylaminobenzene 5'-phosphate synthase
MSVLMPPPMSVEQAAVVVRAPARLHLGFLDPSGSLGRRFGSLGLVVDGWETAVEMAAARRDELSAVDPAAQSELDRAATFLQRLREHTGHMEPVALRLLATMPAHAGLGSGTQLALAVGRAFTRWHGLNIDAATLAGWLGRGARSGIGIGGFEQGGLLVDGGPGADERAAPVLARVDLPAAWRIVLVLDERRRGLSGNAERQAIGALAALPQSHAADICHQVLMRVLPGAAAGDFAAFAAGINRVQDLLGAHFAPAQGGSAYTSPAIGSVMQWIGARPPGAAIGQSSWGPTGFAILPSLEHAQQAVAAARDAGMLEPALTVRIVAARRRGATVEDRRVAARPI